MVVGTFHVHTLAYKGANGIDHNYNTVLQVCTASACDVVVLKETRHGHGPRRVWNGARAVTKKKEEVHRVGVHRVGLTIMESIVGVG